MADIITFFAAQFNRFFGTSYTATSNSYLLRLCRFITGDPLIMAVAAIFFVGAVVGFFIRVYHSIL